MNKLTFLILVGTLISVQFVCADSVRLQEIRYGNKTLVFEVDREKLLQTGSYTPETDAPPLSIKDACRIALAYSKTQHPDVKDFCVTGVGLKSGLLVGAPRRWYFYLNISPIVSGNTLPFPASDFDLIVLFDGSVIPPRQL